MILDINFETDSITIEESDSCGVNTKKSKANNLIELLLEMLEIFQRKNGIERGEIIDIFKCQVRINKYLYNISEISKNDLVKSLIKEYF